MKPSSTPLTPVYYSDYLQLDRVLSSQKMRSEEVGRPAHDEMLFIIVHQAYELWFKQILHDLNSVVEMFRQSAVDEKNIGIAVSRLHRIVQIQKLIIEQIPVLETMTPLDFLDFRDLLVPASGFQSTQFRLIENMMGLKSERRVLFDDKHYASLLSEKDRQLLEKSEKDSNLFDLVQRWLERTPFLQWKDFDFLKLFRASVERMMSRDEEIIRGNPALSENGRNRQIENLRRTRENFEALFDEKKYEELRKKGYFQLSYSAALAALLISLYRDQPILHLPHKFLSALVEIDQYWTTWRYRHALMVQRMIGSKIGTGGSAGFQYLKETAERHHVFGDFFSLSTFLIPRSELPVLPKDVQKTLGFFYQG